ncbi:hypothetical protein [Aureispira sp. CCB-E]|uniref:hypothetical protein n=1 Tax=Aureispira sp. CCB-E TaxID=3051121 RepID=UPI0028697D2D|nr:hypothetical protein [Aureispira sp. CCB-E]WMX13216.1 hypothetical protein QP953_20440 [Aureispira sp. CCB-E]
MKISTNPNIYNFFNEDLVELNYSEIEYNSFFHENFSDWINNALQFQRDFPEKTSIYWTELMRSDFTLKFLFEVKEVLRADVNDWDNQKRVDFVCYFFENAYYHFAFLSFCMNYSQTSISRLCETWNYPQKAQKCEKWRQNAWKIGTNFTSGKNWILHNCDLFRQYDGDISLVKEIRNSKSHSDLIIKKDRIILLNEENSHVIYSGELNGLVKFLHNSFLVTCEFHSRLLIEHYFWLLPSIVLTLPEKFNYTKRNIKSDLVKDDESEQTKELKKDKFFSSSDQVSKFSEFIIFCVNYLMQNFWKDFKEREDLINLLLAPRGMNVKTEKILDIQLEIAVEFINLLFQVKKSVVQKVYDKEIEIQKYTVDSILEVDVQEVLEDVSKVVLEALEVANTDQKNFMLSTLILHVFMTFILSMHSIMSNYRTLFVEQDS